MESKSDRPSLESGLVDSVASAAKGEVTLLLERARDGANEEVEDLVSAVYKELRRTASALMRREKSGHTLSTTDLAHEAYLRLFSGDELPWIDQKQFYMSAAVAMRRVLIDHARRRQAGKRIPKDNLVPTDEAVELAVDPELDLLDLDEALKNLAKLSPRQAKVVELRYFVGLTEPEIAKILGVSLVSVSRDWRVARLWLRREMSSGSLPL